MFNDLDVQDDKLMLDLAVFLNRLVRGWFSSNMGIGLKWVLEIVLLLVAAGGVWPGGLRACTAVCYQMLFRVVQGFGDILLSVLDLQRQ